MPRLDHVANALPRVAQEATCWCIPACFENLLTAVGVSGVSQSSLVAEYCRRHPKDALNDCAKIVALPPDSSQILALAKSYALTHASFGEFKAIAEHLYDLGSLGVSFELHRGLTDHGDYYDLLCQMVDAGKPGILSASVGRDLWHVGVFFGYAGDAVEFFDPASGRVEQKKRAGLDFSTDLLSLSVAG